MENRADNLVPEMNDWANTSLWLGIISLLPYLTSVIGKYLEMKLDTIFFQAEFLITFFCLLWGIILGPVSLVTGIVGIRQINNSKGTETGIRSAILGIVLGIIGITTNILFVFLFLISFVRD